MQYTVYQFYSVFLSFFKTVKAGAGIAVLLATLIPSVTLATTPINQTGKIEELWVNDGSTSNVAYITLGQIYETPCRPTPTAKYFIIDLTEPGMQEAYAMALAAYLANHTVKIRSTGSCYGGTGLSETLRFIYLDRDTP